MPPTGQLTSRKVTPPEIRYRESALRQREKSEAHTLRVALEDMDIQDEESRIHRAAQLEAADLVWKHRNPGSAEQEKSAPYRNPDLAKKSYVIRADGSALDREERSVRYRASSGSPTESSMDSGKSLEYTKRSSARQSRDWSSANGHNSRRRSSGGRQVSSGSSRGVFRNPEDEIYEEPEQSEYTTPQDIDNIQPLRTRTQNPSTRGSRPLPNKPIEVGADNQPGDKKFDINRNAVPSSRNAARGSLAYGRSQTPEDERIAKGRPMEIRSEEIRAATSMRRSDRSPKLPNPTAVSDKLGRPIVSFDPSWRPLDSSARGSADAEIPSSRSLPAKPATATPPRVGFSPVDSNTKSLTRPRESNEVSTIPVIKLPDEERVQDFSSEHDQQLPSIAISAPEITVSAPISEERNSMIPSINVGEEAVTARPLPSISAASNSSRHSTNVDRRAALKQPAGTPADKSANRLSWLGRDQNVPTIGGSRASTVACTACDLPISGRIVTASGASNKHKARFHPECFTCFHCSTGLECVSFYPEPESSRLARLGLQDDQATDNVRHDLTESADLRFYCHLDYHDLFSPRCGSCHTPIEGFIILAAGKSWHEGHFFCAECGDPFSSTSPFVETQGYAYCVGCHTKRTSARCKACKKQILEDVMVEALGGKWHEECFRCDECDDDFGEDGKFFVREVEIELTEKEKRRGLDYRKVEERAVCNGCEARRLKSRDVAAFL